MLMVCALLIAALFLKPLAATAQETTTLPQRMANANEHYRQGDYGTALRQYESLSHEAPGDALLLYNKGCALYQLGEYEQAAAAFAEAANAATDHALRGKAQYNRGVALHALLRQDPDAEPQGILPLLEQSAQAFREALDLDPTDMQAARNLERLRARIHALRQLQEQAQLGSEPSPDGDTSDQHDEDEGREGAGAGERQPGEQERSDQGVPSDAGVSDDDGQPGDEESQRPMNASEALERLAAEQERAADVTDSVADQVEGMNESQREQAQRELQEYQQQLSDLTELAEARLADQSEALAEARRSQRQAEQALVQQDFREAAEHMREAAERLQQTAHAAAEQEMQQREDERAQRDSALDEMQHEWDLSHEDGQDRLDEEILSQILDKERADRQRRDAARARAEAGRVERDW